MLLCVINFSISLFWKYSVIIKLYNKNYFNYIKLNLEGVNKLHLYLNNIIPCVLSFPLNCRKPLKCYSVSYYQLI